MSNQSKSHTIREGETMSSIAQRVGLSLAELMAANLHITNPDSITVGQTLLIPAKGDEVNPVAVITEMQIYTLRSGDTLAIIAKRYEIDLKTLLKANKDIKNPDRVRAGQRISIPVKGGAQPAESESTSGNQPTEDPNAILARCRPAGASMRTARQDRLRVSGVDASRRMAENDTRMVLPYKGKFEEAARIHVQPPALLAAIASRESRGGAVLDRNGEGDGGHGFGLMQVDNRNRFPVVRDGGPFGQPHINQATKILADKLKQVKKDFPDLTPEQQLQTAVSRYNGGSGRPHPDSDVGTTGGDYSNDVLARAQYYAELWKGGVAPSVATPAATNLGSARGFTRAPSLEDIQAQKEVLKVGHEGAAVTRVQELLGSVGVDGKFGEETRQAVIAFQKAHNITPSGGMEGMVDKATLEILGTVHAARPARSGDVVYGRHTVSDQKLKELLQKIADFTGSKVRLTSGDRVRVVNNNSRSHHLVGRAADFWVEGLTLREAYERLKDAVIPTRDYQFIYHTEVTVAPHLHIGRYNDNRPSTFIVDTGQILRRRR